MVASQLLLRTCHSIVGQLRTSQEVLTGPESLTVMAITRMGWGDCDLDIPQVDRLLTCGQWKPTTHLDLWEPRLAKKAAIGLQGRLSVLPVQGENNRRL